MSELGAQALNHVAFAHPAKVALPQARGVEWESPNQVGYAVKPCSLQHSHALLDVWHLQLVHAYGVQLLWKVGLPRRVHKSKPCIAEHVAQVFVRASDTAVLPVHNKMMLGCVFFHDYSSAALEPVFAALEEGHHVLISEVSNAPLCNAIIEGHAWLVSGRQTERSAAYGSR